MTCCFYMRSSSLGTLAMCEMQYFINYGLGFENKSNLAANKGSIVHRVLQGLGDYKICKTKGMTQFDDEDLGLIDIDVLQDLEYMTEFAYNKYSSSTPELAWSNKHKKECLNWVYKAIEYNDGFLDPRNQSIHAVEQFFDIELEHDWAKYEYDIKGEKYTGNLSLKGTVDVIIEDDTNILQIQDYKGLPVDTPIPTPEGWTTMGDIKVGDVVFDQYGKQTNVVAKSSKKFKDCYKIEFDDTSSVVCDDEHYWKLEDGSVVQIEDLKIGNCINVAKPIDCDIDIDLPIDPYVLGIWLGDDRNRGGEVCSGDYEIFEELEGRGYEVGNNLEKRQVNCESRTLYGLTTELKSLNLTHNKHIPTQYLRASYEQRLDLLRGLMDSDGSVNTTRRQCVFMNCNKRLSEDVRDLLLTLGQRPLMSECKAYGFGVETTSYPVSFRPVDIEPFLLIRKKNKIDLEWGSGLSYRRRVVSITKTEKRLTQCISVDSEDRTYLCTHKLIPTHNTGKRMDWAADPPKEKNFNDLMKDTQLLFYYYALSHLYPDKMIFMSIFYINHGGLFMLPFDESHYKKAEELIKKKFEYIKAIKNPKVISNNMTHFKCRRMCKYSSIIPEISKSVPACHAIKDYIKKHGTKDTIDKFIDVDKVSKYQAGGGRTAEQSND